MPHTITLTGPRLRQGANMHPTLPPPQGPNQKRRFRFPHAQATRERKHQKQEEIGGQGAQGRSLEEFQNQVMHRIFDHLSDPDKEVEDRANGGREVTGVNANNHVGVDKDHRNRSCRSRRPAHAATKHTYKSNSRRLRDNQWEDRKPEGHGSAGLAKQCVGEGHHVVFSYQNMRGNKEVMNGETEGHHQRTEIGRTRIIASEFEGSKYNCYVDQDRKDEEVKRTRKMGPTKDELHEVLHDVVGDSDENGLALYGDTEDENRSPTEGDGHCADILQPMDATRDKDMCCERESKHCGPPLNLVVPHIPPPGQPDRLKLIKVPNVVGINPKPFDPETYMEEDDFFTDESNGKKSVHKNVVHCRMANNADGTKSLESNARFVQWKDGSMQLLIGDVALDVSVEESSQHTHLFRKNGKGLRQSQGRLLQKMGIMPPESSSSSHSSLTAPVDSQNKKTIEVQAWYDKKDHERMKQERERAEEKNIQARSILRKKKEKVNHKYTQSHKGKQKLTSGFFYDALDEDESPSSWYNPHGRVAHTGFEHDLEFEALAQRRIINAKAHEYYESESEELEYETEFEDIESSPTHERENELDENNVYDKDLGVSSLPNEEIEGQEQKRGPRKGKVIDFGEQYPPKKRFLNRWRGNCY